MSHEADRFLQAFEVAWRLGYRTVAIKPWYGHNPKTPEEVADKKAMQAFYQAKSAGDVPPPDMTRGSVPLWRESTIARVIAQGGGRFVPTQRARRGRPAKASLRAPSEPEGEAAHA